MFNEFIEKKEAKSFNNDLIDATKGCAQLMQIDTNHGDQIFKVIINPDAKRTICFVSGSEKGGSYGILEFLKSDFYVPKTKKIIFLPLVKDHHIQDIWNEIKNDYVLLLCNFQDTKANSWQCYTNIKELASDIKSLAKKYFSISDSYQESDELKNKILTENGISYLITKTPVASLNKLKEYNKNAIKLIINSQ